MGFALQAATQFGGFGATASRLLPWHRCRANDVHHFLAAARTRPWRGTSIFLVDTAAISMRFADDVPCAREMAANMVNMLEVWGFDSAHFVGHSFGTIVVAWVLRYQREHVERCTFIDPV